MRIRLLVAAVCVLALPVCLSGSKGDKLIQSLPFATVAIAGHTLTGEWCACGTPGCICDPGELSAKPVRDPSPVERGGKAKLVRVDDLDLGTGALLLALALFVWSRLRA